MVHCEPGTKVYTVETPEGTAVGEFVIRETPDGFSVSHTPFFNNFEIDLPRAKAKRLIAALERKDWAKVDRADPEMLPWYCRECARVYREKDWRTHVTFDDGFFDALYGYCPQGHRRMIAD